MNLKEQLEHARVMGYISEEKYKIYKNCLEQNKLTVWDVHYAIRSNNLLTYQKFISEIHKEDK